ncbi:protein translocase subunit SecF [bacterium]|nr:protein translocase subunit SecF [bacterium]
MKLPFSFIKFRKVFYLFSLLLVLVSILLVVFWRFNLGIDFAGGSVLKIRFEKEVTKDRVAAQLKQAGFDYFQIQPSEKEYFIRTQNLEENDYCKLKEALRKVADFKELSYESVGPSVSKDLQRKALLGVVLASIAIILYVAYAFRSVPEGYSSWFFGIVAVIALIHDALIVLGSFSFLGHFSPKIVIDSYFITALLTTIGYSVNDTIVVFDRVRENLIKEEGALADLADLSIWQTLARSVGTAFTTILVLLSLYLLGGESIKNFSLALAIGVGIGTYSSIFLATPLLVDLLQRKKKKVV